jgi:hypothetical protein
MGAAKILAVDDKADFELLITPRFRRQIREREFAFRFAHHGEEPLAVELHLQGDLIHFACSFHLKFSC